MRKVAVIGGGPAGMLAAACAAKNGCDTVIIERNEKLGKKLFLTGKGRCNLTNSADIEEFFPNFSHNPKFLYSALYGFTNADIIALVESMGVPTKTERGGRVFPESDKSSDIIGALSRYAAKCGAKTWLRANVKRVLKENGKFIVEIEDKRFEFDNVILACGGASYPTTGSDGSGYALAEALGHSVTEIRPSLIPLETVEEWPKTLMGLSLRNVRLNVFNAKNKRVYSEIGEMLFTHFGVSGPLVLTASAHIADAPEGAKLVIDMKPGLDEDELDRRLVRDFEKNSRKSFRNSLDDLLPQKLIPVAVELSGIKSDTPAHDITREMRQSFCHLLKNVTMNVKAALPIEQAIITRGGIPVREINASTMESKLVEGLYFAGEMIDVDAYTGGFNLQIAFSTGALAGNSLR